MKRHLVVHVHHHMVEDGGFTGIIKFFNSNSSIVIFYKTQIYLMYNLDKYFRCNTGFDLEYGDSLRTCQPNGQWSGRQPV